MSDKIILVDGNSIVNRAFFGIPLSSNSNGEFTNAVYGFLNMVLKLCVDENATHLAVAFDMPTPTFRHKLFPDYKAGRKAMPDELRPQFFTLKNLLEKMNINYYQLAGYEADDILGTCANIFSDKGFSVIVFSGDRDLLQVAGGNVKVFIPKTQNHRSFIDKYSYDDVLEKIGVTPNEFIDVKALMGDKADNISGVPGIGEKNATKIVSEYKSIENAIVKLREKKKLNKCEKNLCDFEEQALFCKKLVTINTNIPINVDTSLTKLNNPFNNDSASELKRLNLDSFVKRFADKFI